MNGLCNGGIYNEWPVINVICYERDLLLTRSVMNVICYERGL